jgi:DNA-binding GntR family transcriptional regulator
MMPLTKSQLNDDVVELLRSRIYTGEYPPGTPLRQEQLALELGVSRTPLREAFRSLRHEGLLEQTSQGVRVISVDLPKVLEAYTLREVLEGLTARLAAEHGGAALAEELDGILEEQQQAVERGDFPRYTEANVRFHLAIWRAAENEFVLADSHILRMTAQLFVPQAVVPRTLAREALEAHREIADAIARGLEQDAERLARAHIRHTIDALRARLAQSPPRAGGEEAGT